MDCQVFQSPWCQSGILGSCFSSVESPATIGFKWKSFSHISSQEWFFRWASVLCGFRFCFLRFCQVVLNEAFFPVRGISTSLAVLQSVLSSSNNLDQVFLFWLHLTHLHFCSPELCMDRRSSVVWLYFWTIKCSANYSYCTGRTLRGGTWGQGIIWPFMPLS